MKNWKILASKMQKMNTNINKTEKKRFFKF